MAATEEKTYVGQAVLRREDAKLLRGEYPAGYTPSRPGQTMPRFEYLKDHIDDLAAYLQQH